MSNVYRQALEEMKERIEVYEAKSAQLRAALPTLESLAAEEDAATSGLQKLPPAAKRGPYKKKGEPRPPVIPTVVVKNGRKRAAVDPRPGGHLLSPRHTCPECGRPDLKKATGKFGQAGGLRGHSAATICELPCLGGATATLGRKMKKLGLHSKASCPGCRPAKAAPPVIAPAPARKFVPGKSTSMAGKKKVIVAPPCPVCGRTNIERPPGPGRSLPFHRAPICELPCKGGTLMHATAEDLADGTHTGPACYGCSQKAKEA